MKTLIIGASGQIGKMTTKKMLEQGHDVVALVRNKSKLADIQSEQLTITEQDLEGDFSSAFDNVEQVIFSAGSGGETGALQNEPATGGFSTSRPTNREDAVISRENVADALVYLATQHPQNLTFELFNGKQSVEQTLR
ncbi:NAD(P)-dependent oxidoreductase [Pseudoalteromonas sp. CO342X]|uniref:NAD(P)-binding oxidoreductase n=1 Tax=Pseudoalteromonas sp. CO342X TaxID=1777270 RepID=UPI0010236265|nr:NAD(P)-binding oxidoreductase [Pseudoalteromonas sp. CO342X]RZG14730.1 NAD(P)-dependent oxidoreductase [Pseudoalteromonas sp. CO342X]